MLITLVVFAGLSGLPLQKSLASACRDGDLTVEAKPYAGHSIASLDITNRRNHQLIIDVNGSYLVPEAGDPQRLGLGLVQAGNPDTSVRLGPGARVQIKILSVCMDASKRGPGVQDRYQVAKNFAPDRILQILREWKDRPSLDPSTVQSVVWGNSPTSTLERVPQPQRINSADLQVVRKSIVHGGNVFVLNGDGKLFQGSQSKALKLIARKFLDLWTDGRLFAIRQVPNRFRKGALKTVISRFDHDTGGWGDVLDVVPGNLLWVAPNSTAAVVQTLRNDVLLIDSLGETQLLANPRSVAVTPAGQIYWVPSERPNRVYGLRPDLKAVRIHTHDVPIRSLICPGKFPYVLDRERNLVCLKNGKPAFRLRYVLRVERVGSRLLATVSQPVAGQSERRVVRLAEDSIEPQSPLPHPPRHNTPNGSARTIPTIDRGITLRSLNSLQNWNSLARSSPQEVLVERR